MTGQVTPLPRGRSNAEMSVVGMLIAAPLLILLVPLLPVIVLLWLFGSLLKRVRGERDT